MSFDHEFRNPGGTLFQLGRWQIYYQESETTQRTFEARTNTSVACSGVAPGNQHVYLRPQLRFPPASEGRQRAARKAVRNGGGSDHLIYGVDYSVTHTAEVRDALRTNVTTGVSTQAIPPDISRHVISP